MRVSSSEYSANHTLSETHSLIFASLHPHYDFLLHGAPTRHLDRLSVHIAEQRTRHRQHRARRFCRCPGPPQWDISVLLSTRSLLLLLWDAERDLLAVGKLHESAGLLCCRQTRCNVTERDCVGAHAKVGAPSAMLLVSSAAGTET